MNITLSQAEAAIKAAKEKSREPGTLSGHWRFGGLVEDDHAVALASANTVK